MKPQLTRRQALIVRELARTPGRSVAWYILADAIGEDAGAPTGKYRVQAHIQNIRKKFGRDAILTNTGFGYYVNEQIETKP